LLTAVRFPVDFML